MISSWPFSPTICEVPIPCTHYSVTCLTGMPLAEGTMRMTFCGVLMTAALSVSACGPR